MRLLVAGLLGATLCAAPLGAQTQQRFEFERGAMGTTFRVVLYATDSTHGHRAASAAFDRVDELTAVLSDYDPASELSQLSKTAGSGRWVSVSDDLWAVLTRSDRLAVETDGAFDVTIGPLTRLWRWASRRGVMPLPDRISHARTAVGYRLMAFDHRARRVRLTSSGMRLDLGAIGKGFAADEALAVLSRAGVRSALVDAGGDIVASGAPPGTSGWRVAIPAVEAGAVVTQAVRLTDGAVATSGDEYRYVEVAGVRYSHILDPATGLGLIVRRIATVLAPTGADADALASAVTVLGPLKGIALLEGKPGVSGRVLEQDGVVWRGWDAGCTGRVQSQVDFCGTTVDRISRSSDKHRN